MPYSSFGAYLSYNNIKNNTGCKKYLNTKNIMDAKLSKMILLNEIKRRKQ